jgi:rRNA maturation RNase YbeY
LNLDVAVNNIQNKPIKTGQICELVQLIWQGEAGNDGDICIVLTDDRHIVALNQQYLQKDHVTDVIAFPLEDSREGFQGEIYISVAQVLRNADVYKVRPEHELLRVAAHGTLHFLGFRDETQADKERMTAHEDHYLAQIVV